MWVLILSINERDVDQVPGANTRTAVPEELEVTTKRIRQYEARKMIHMTTDKFPMRGFISAPMK